MNHTPLCFGVKLGVLAISLAPSVVMAAERPISHVDAIESPEPLFYEQPIFLEDIGILPDETLQTYSGECTGIESCGDYFDVPLNAGERLFVSLCPPDGTADFDTGISIWDTSDIAGGAIVAFDDTCDLQTEITFEAPANGTYRVLIGTFDLVLGGSYTVAYQKLLPRSISISTEGDVVVGGGFLKLPITDSAPLPGDCPSDYSNEGGMVYDWSSNVIWVCAPDFGGWNSLTLIPPAP